MTNDEWSEKLTPEQYDILRNAATETPGTGALLHNKAEGKYLCAGCSAKLFSSDHKFDSGSGWPSFYDLASEESVDLVDDMSLGMHRVEVVCKTCGGHLGHVFNDAHDMPTGQRYCINSGALQFEDMDGNITNG